MDPRKKEMGTKLRRETWEGTCRPFTLSSGRDDESLEVTERMKRRNARGQRIWETPGEKKLGRGGRHKKNQSFESSEVANQKVKKEGKGQRRKF